MTKPFFVLRVGDFDVALHPGAVVMVIPEDYKATRRANRLIVPSSECIKHVGALGGSAERSSGCEDRAPSW